MPKDVVSQESTKLFNETQRRNDMFNQQRLDQLLSSERAIQQSGNRIIINGLVIPEHNGPSYDIFKYVRNPELRPKIRESKRQVFQSQIDSHVSLQVESQPSDEDFDDISETVNKHQILQQPEQQYTLSPQRVLNFPQKRQPSQNDKQYQLEIRADVAQDMVKKYQDEINSLHTTIQQLQQQQATTNQQYLLQLQQYKMYQTMIGEELREQKQQNSKLRAQILDNQQHLFKVDDTSDQIKLNNNKIILVLEQLKIKQERMLLLLKQKELAQALTVELEYPGILERQIAEQAAIYKKIVEERNAAELLHQQQQAALLAEETAKAIVAAALVDSLKQDQEKLKLSEVLKLKEPEIAEAQLEKVQEQKEEIRDNRRETENNEPLEFVDVGKQEPDEESKVEPEKPQVDPIPQPKKVPGKAPAPPPPCQIAANDSAPAKKPPPPPPAKGGGFKKPGPK